ncbi:MAG: Type 1 glutamine amidotransferase-like domain-containing protein [Anaerolineales bacterium]|nr:Type 1 glutamine amidotransferase-like domain-containing protein [Anaerolineales bacterium]
MSDGGCLALVGSGEFLEPMRPVDRQLLERCGGSRVVVLPTASAPDRAGVPQRWMDLGVAHFRALGAQAEGVLALRREDCDLAEYADAVGQANLVYFSGGKPDYLFQTLERTALWQAALRVLAGGGVLAGCSAGAMILGSHIPDVDSFPRLVRWGPGFGLVPEALVIPHFDEIPSALASLAYRLRPRGSYLIGVEGGTALVGKDRGWQVLGSGAVTVRRGQRAERIGPGQSVELP